MEAKEREEEEVFVWPQVKCEGHIDLSTLISDGDMSLMSSGISQAQRLFRGPGCSGGGLGLDFDDGCAYGKAKRLEECWDMERAELSGLLGVRKQMS